MLYNLIIVYLFYIRSPIIKKNIAIENIWKFRTTFMIMSLSKNIDLKFIILIYLFPQIIIIKTIANNVKLHIECKYKMGIILCTLLLFTHVIYYIIIYIGRN